MRMTLRYSAALLQVVLVLLAFSISQSLSAAESFDSRGILERYRVAMTQRDAGALERMILPDALIKVSLVKESEPNIVISLSRAEYLQQMRALWRFSSEQRYTIDLRNVQEVGDNQWNVVLTQKDEYTLFGESIGQQSDIVMQCELHDGAIAISAIRTVTRQW